MRKTFVFALVALAVIAAAPHVSSAFDVGTHGPLLLGSMLSLPAPLPVQVPSDAPPNVMSLERARVTPSNGYEVYEDFLYDTVTYVQAGPAAGTLTRFFNTASGDLTITNLGATPGSLPSPQWFHIKRLFITPLMEPSLNAASTAAGRLADWDKIQFSARSFLSFTYSGQTKSRPSIPLEALGGLGGQSAVFVGGNSTAPATTNRGQNHLHGGFPFDQILKYNEQFQFQLFVGVQTAISADLPLRLMCYGWRYVKT